LIGGVSLGLLVGTVGTYMVGADARKTYLSTNDPKADFDGPYSTWENMANVNHILAIAFLTAYTFNLVDAIMYAKPAPATLGMGPGQEPIQFSYLSNGQVAFKARLLEF
jgi:hypothetical protein